MCKIYGHDDCAVTPDGFSSRFYRVSFTEASRFCRHVFLEPKADLIKGVGVFFFRPELSRRQW